MPSCAICGKSLFCHDQATHPPPLEVDGTTQACPLTKGALWVHTIDQKGNDLKNLGVKSDVGAKVTDSAGIATFDPLDPRVYSVSLDALSADMAKHYDPPTVASKQVGVQNGAIAYVVFELKQRAKLKVKLTQQGKAETVLKAAEVEVTGPENPPAGKTGSSDGMADFGSRTAGSYAIRIKTLASADAPKYKLPAAATSVTLEPGDDITVPIELVRDAWAKVKLAFKDDQSDVSKAKFELRIGDNVVKSGDLENGLADIRPLDDEAYELCFPDIDAAEWAAA
jgi:hypothetical protein